MLFTQWVTVALNSTSIMSCYITACRINAVWKPKGMQDVDGYHFDESHECYDCDKVFKSVYIWDSNTRQTDADNTFALF